MSTVKELDEALVLVEQICTSDQIKELLRKRKGDDNIWVSAENKETLVSKNLREAVETKVIQIGEIFDLIRASEESGNQHIFYYRPPKKIAEALSLENVGKNIWGANWKAKIEDFPTLKLKPDDYRISDFRAYGPTKPKDWILKIYGQKMVTFFTGKIEQRADNTFWKEFKDEPLRIIMMARWNSPDLLEIRVQRNESRRRIEEWHKEVWKVLEPALAKTSCDAWALRKLMAKLILQQDKYAKIYSFRDASVVDKTGVHASFQTESDQGNLFASAETKKAVKSYMESESDCSGLTVTWLENSKAAPMKDIRTLLGARESNEVIVPGRCIAGDLDYVTDQFRFFSK